MSSSSRFVGFLLLHPLLQLTGLARYVQEEVIYPHPDAKSNPKLAELFFCRQCFAERFRKGNWRVPFASYVSAPPR